MPTSEYVKAIKSLVPFGNTDIARALLTNTEISNEDISRANEARGLFNTLASHLFEVHAHPEVTEAVKDFIGKCLDLGADPRDISQALTQNLWMRVYDHQPEIISQHVFDTVRYRMFMSSLELVISSGSTDYYGHMHRKLALEFYLEDFVNKATSERAEEIQKLHLAAHVAMLKENPDKTEAILQAFGEEYPRKKYR